MIESLLYALFAPVATILAIFFIVGLAIVVGAVDDDDFKNSCRLLRCGDTNCECNQ
jgi:hypothetical protein